MHILSQTFSILIWFQKEVNPFSRHETTAAVSPVLTLFSGFNYSKAKVTSPLQRSGSSSYHARKDGTLDLLKITNLKVDLAMIDGVVESDRVCLLFCFPKGVPMKKITLPKLMRWIAVLIFIIGTGLGYDAGDKQVVLDGQVIELFSFWLALLYWFLAFALGVLFLAVARILELLDR